MEITKPKTYKEIFMTVLLCIGLIMIIVGIVFCAKSIYLNGSFWETKVDTSAAFGGDYYTYSVRYNAYTVEAIGRLHNMVSTGLKDIYKLLSDIAGAFLIFLGLADICICFPKTGLLKTEPQVNTGSKPEHTSSNLSMPPVVSMHAENEKYDQNESEPEQKKADATLENECIEDTPCAPSPSVIFASHADGLSDLPLTSDVCHDNQITIVDEDSARDVMQKERPLDEPEKENVPGQADNCPKEKSGNAPVPSDTSGFVRCPVCNTLQRDNRFVCYHCGLKFDR